MNSLRLGLLEKDLADRFNIKQTEVSEMFLTWIDRMQDCLGQLSFTTDRDTMKRFLPKCSKPGHEDVYGVVHGEAFSSYPTECYLVRVQKT